MPLDCRLLTPFSPFAVLPALTRLFRAMFRASAFSVRHRTVAYACRALPRDAVAALPSTFAAAR